MVAGDIPGVVIFNPARGMSETVPDAFAFSILVPGAFNLVSRGGSAP